MLPYFLHILVCLGSLLEPLFKLQQKSCNKFFCGDVPIHFYVDGLRLIESMHFDIIFKSYSKLQHGKAKVILITQLQDQCMILLSRYDSFWSRTYWHCILKCVISSCPVITQEELQTGAERELLLIFQTKFYWTLALTIVKWQIMQLCYSIILHFLLYSSGNLFVLLYAFLHIN